jgi:hypothetical protein
MEMAVALLVLSNRVISVLALLVVFLFVRTVQTTVSTVLHRLFALFVTL